MVEMFGDDSASRSLYDEDTPMVFVGRVTAFGRRIGKWLIVDEAPTDIREAIKQVVAEIDPARPDDWSVLEYRGFSGLDFGPNPNLDELAELGRHLDHWGPVVADLVRHLGGVQHTSKALWMLRERFEGAWESLGKWAARRGSDSDWTYRSILTLQGEDGVLIFRL